MTILNRIKAGQSIPTGFFISDEGFRKSYGLSLPVWFWRGMFYDIAWDAYCYGWKSLGIFIRISPQGCGVLDVRLARGWRMIKETHRLVRQGDAYKRGAKFAPGEMSYGEYRPLRPGEGA